MVRWVLEVVSNVRRPCVGKVPHTMPPKQKRGVAVLKEIEKLTNTVNILTSKRAFKRIITGMVREGHPARNKKGHNAIKFKPNAITALHQATEAYLTRLFEDTNLVAIHAKRTTIEEKDMLLACKLRGDKDALWWTRRKP